MAKSANRSVRLEKGLRLFKPSYTSNGRKGTAKRWYVEFPYLRQARRLPGYADQQLTAELARKVVTLARWREAGESPDPAILRWVETLPDQVREPLVRWGLVDERRTKTLTTHLEDWKAVLLAGGCTDNHARVQVNRVRRIADGCGFATWSDISASRAKTFLGDLRTDQVVRWSTKRGKQRERTKKGVSAASFNHYLGALKAFCAWMVLDRRARDNPVDHLEGVNTEADRRHDRQVLSLDELRWLLDVTERGHSTIGADGRPVEIVTAAESFGVPPAERALLYRLAIETGLRAGELRSLARSSFLLDGDEPTVTVAAGYSKNRKQAVLPLRVGVVAMLKRHLQRKLPAAKVFTLPRKEEVVKMFRADLAAARRAWIAAAESDDERRKREEATFCTYGDENGLVADFHALRHSCGYWLLESGVDMRVVQKIMRHSTIKLTVDRYGKLRGLLGVQAQRMAVGKLPGFTPPDARGRRPREPTARRVQ